MTRATQTAAQAGPTAFLDFASPADAPPTDTIDLLGSATLSICGMDEVGRGAFAGPLVAAAVVLPPGFHHRSIRDSKLLSPGARERAATLIRETALKIAIVSIPAARIDERGVGWANIDAFCQLIDQVTADLYCCDGNLKLPTQRHYVSLPRADATVPSVAAASIIAKVYRDQVMIDFSAGAPAYDWDRNKGYGSAAHCAALRVHGMHPQHRRSFIHFPTGTAVSPSEE